MSILEFVILFFIFLMTVTVHEVSHGAVAYFRGDQTAKLMGRLTLNPFKHIDLFWTIIFPGMLFLATHGSFALGMAKPVPVNSNNLKNPKKDMIFVAFAGPLANIIFAWILSICFQLTGYAIFLYAVYLNIGLACFNLIPIPPLDGSKILMGILPDKSTRAFEKIERFGFFVILALYMSGFLFAIIRPGINFLARLLNVPTFDS